MALTVFTDQLIGAICNTLVYSLWQGLLLAALAGFIVLATRKTSSVLRYNLLIAALMLFVIGSAATFIMQLSHIESVVGGVLPVAGGLGAAVVAPTVVMHEAGSSNIVLGVLDYLNGYHNTIVLIWFMIICAKSIQLCVGLYSTYRLKNTYTTPIGGFWSERMQQLAALSGIRQTVAFLESGIAKVPMVIGHLKPVVLIPVGLLTALSAEEVEAVIIHELAHIKRRDYLVNLLQGLVEIVFFFNPAVLWISQLIKTERENCCDDLVLAQNSNKVDYIRALISCEEYQAAMPQYAMAFAGKNTLLSRVKRLAESRNQSLNLFERTLFAICLVVSGLCMSAFAAKEDIKRSIHAVESMVKHTTVNKVEEHKLNVQTEAIKQQTDVIAQNTVRVNDTKSATAKNADTNKRKPVRPEPPTAPAKPVPAAQPEVGTPATEPMTPTKPIAPMPMMKATAPVKPTAPAATPKAIAPVPPLAPPPVPTIAMTAVRPKIAMAPMAPMKAKLSPMSMRVNIDTPRRIKVKVKAPVKVTVNDSVNTDVHVNVSTNYDNAGTKIYTNKSTKTYSAHSKVYNNDSVYKPATAKTYTNYSYSYPAKAGKTYSAYTKTYKSDSVYKTPATKNYTNYSYTYSGDGASSGKPVALKRGSSSMPSLADELIKAHLITDAEKNTFSAHLDNNELVINGIKRSEDEHQQILKKFAKSPADKVNLYYRYVSDKTDKK